MESNLFEDDLFNDLHQLMEKYSMIIMCDEFTEMLLEFITILTFRKLPDINSAKAQIINVVSKVVKSYENQLIERRV